VDFISLDADAVGLLYISWICLLASGTPTKVKTSRRLYETLIGGYSYPTALRKSTLSYLPEAFLTGLSLAEVMLDLELEVELEKIVSKAAGQI
jgi:hypothetical protein